MRRIRFGEALAGAGAVALCALLFLHWFSGGRSGWSSLGWAMVALLVAVIILALTVAGSVIARVHPAVAVGSAVVTVVLTLVTLIVALIRVLVAQPGGSSTQLCGYLGLAALAMILAGAWTTIADERTGAPESAYTPPPPRPLPNA
jgi:hypothetical protein